MDGAFGLIVAGIYMRMQIKLCRVNYDSSIGGKESFVE